MHALSVARQPMIGPFAADRRRATRVTSRTGVNHARSMYMNRQMKRSTIHCRSVRPHQATRHEEHDASLQEYERRLGQLRAEALAEVGPGAYVEGSACPLLVDFR